MIRRALVAAVFALAPARAVANDSTAEVAAGGLVLKRSEAIRIESEQLYLSVDRIKVRYVFRNETAQPIRTIVAFPIAPFEFGLMDVAVNPDHRDPMQFSVRVGGKVIRPKLERKQRRIKETDTRIVTLTYYWEQTFPPGEPLVVEHSYIPGAGGSVEMPSPGDPEFEKGYGTPYCIEKDLRSWLIVSQRRERPALPTTVSYVLKTGGNWKGPIGDFHLVIDKGKPPRRVSVCLDGLQKTSPTRFEWRRKDFLPTSDLDVLFLEPSG